MNEPFKERATLEPGGESRSAAIALMERHRASHAARKRLPKVAMSEAGRVRLAHWKARLRLLAVSFFP